MAISRPVCTCEVLDVSPALKNYPFSIFISRHYTLLNWKSHFQLSARKGIQGKILP